MNTTNSNRVYYPALDGLRGLAILLVILYHNFDFVHFFQIGWLGVDLFFVLSGFLITDILIKTRSTKNYLRNFYLKRILRIFPLYYLCLIVFLYFGSSFSTIQQQVSYYQANQGWLWLYLQNWLYITNTTNNTNILHHFWSLAVEEQFYLLWPVVVLFIKDYKKLLILLLSLLILVIAFRYMVYVLKPESVSFFALYTFSRIDGLCIGCTLALLRFFNPQWLYKHGKQIILFIIVLNIAYFIIRYATASNIPYIPFLGYPTIASFFGMLVYYATEHKKIMHPLSNSLLTFLGKISYSLYVFHWPVYIILFPYLCTYVKQLCYGSYFFTQLLSSTLCVLLAVGLSIISFYTIEQYFLRLKNKLVC